MANHRSDARAGAPPRPLVVAALLILGGLVSATTAAADPIRVIVTFDVVGSAADPDFAGATASGFFSVITTQEPGTDVLRPEGLGAEALAFTWAGVSWDATNADVYHIGRRTSGSLSAFGVGGSPAGFNGISLTSPDFRMTFCETEDGTCSNITFEYSTTRSAELGIFTAFVPFFSIERQPVESPSPTPEPMTLLLVGSGLCAVAARRTVPAAE
jgi:hypothetical protein